MIRNLQHLISLCALCPQDFLRMFRGRQWRPWLYRDGDVVWENADVIGEVVPHFQSLFFFRWEWLIQKEFCALTFPSSPSLALLVVGLAVAETDAEVVVLDMDAPEASRKISGPWVSLLNAFWLHEWWLKIIGFLHFYDPSCWPRSLQGRIVGRWDCRGCSGGNWGRQELSGMLNLRRESHWNLQGTQNLRPPDNVLFCCLSSSSSGVDAIVEKSAKPLSLARDAAVIGGNRRQRLGGANQWWYGLHSGQRIICHFESLCQIFVWQVRAYLIVYPSTLPRQVWHESHSVTPTFLAQM